MKKIIIILGTIILGVYIVSTLIMGNSGSLKSSAKSINDRSVEVISENLINIDPSK